MKLIKAKGKLTDEGIDQFILDNIGYIAIFECVDYADKKLNILRDFRIEQLRKENEFLKTLKEVKDE